MMNSYAGLSHNVSAIFPLGFKKEGRFVLPAERQASTGTAHLCPADTA